MKTVERIVLSQWQWSLLDDMHVCSLFGTGDYCGLDCCTNAHSIGRTAKTLNASKCLFFQHCKSCLMLGSFSNRKWQRDSWWLVAIGFLESCHTAASATKALPNTRSEVSAKLKLAQPSTLRRRHSSLIWPFAKWKLWREWLSHGGHCWTLACVLSVRYWWLLWTGLLHECPFNGQDWQDFLFFQHVKICSILCSFLLGTGRVNVIPGNDRILGSRQKTSSATKESSWHKVWGVCQAQAFSKLRRRHSSLIWPFAKWKLWREWLSHGGHCWTLACVLSVRDWWLLSAGLLHECPFNGQDWQDFLFFQHVKICSILCSFLLGTGRVNVIPGNDRILGSPRWIRNEGSSQHKVWGVCQTQALSTFKIAKDTRFIDPTFCENGNTEENGSLTSVTGWHLHVCHFFSTGDR